MQIGIYNSCLLEWDLNRLFGWAAEQGYAGVELHGGPRFRHVDWDAVADGRENPVLDAQAKYPVRKLSHVSVVAVGPQHRRFAQHVAAIVRDHVVYPCWFELRSLAPGVAG